MLADERCDRTTKSSERQRVTDQHNDPADPTPRHGTPDRFASAAESLEDKLVNSRRFFTKATVSPDLRTLHQIGGRQADAFYRDRWSHDKVVRSTHGVNCTGSCSWKVYVKDGIITWESQQTDYPSVGPGPARVRAARLPARRRVLLVHLLADPGALPVRARRAAGDVPGGARRGSATRCRVGRHRQRPGAAAKYKSARGKGGLVRASWDEAIEIVAAAHVHTIKRYGPDRVAGLLADPGDVDGVARRRRALLQPARRPMLSFYDWYADLPVASPQVFGDQTDVPESGDWWDAGYLIMWGSNLPVTRTPDAHWMAEARYRGQKVIAVAPDYADNVKFADEWLPAQPGTDGALAMAMGHVILKEFFVDRQVPLLHRLREALHRPAVPGHPRRERRRQRTRPGKFLTAADLGGAEPPRRTPQFKTVAARRGDRRAGRAATVRSASATATTASASGTSTSATSTRCCRRRRRRAAVEVELPRFDAADGAGATMRRGVPVRRGRRAAGHHRVRPAAGPVRRRRARAARRVADAATTTRPSRTRRRGRSRSPASPAQTAARIAREFAANAEESRGRSMIIMGAGTNHWFHSDTIYRSFLTLTTLTGCQGVNGGGWAHYVGQEKVRPITGLLRAGHGLGLGRPARQMIQTAYWYLHTDQFRYDPFSADTLAVGRSAAGGAFAGKTTADLIADVGADGLDAVVPDLRPQPARRWPTRRRRPASPRPTTWSTSCSRAAAVRRRGPGRAGELPAGADDLAGQPARLVGQGQRVLPAAPARHRRRRARRARRPRAPDLATWGGTTRRRPGKLDLLLTLDFRMT